jgi:REP element-mobilizing transposase RayT
VPATFFNPLADLRFTRHHLPHWQQTSGTYFVTLRLADSLPATLLNQWRTERDLWHRQHPEPHSPEVQRDYQNRFPLRMETWLDAGHGACALRDPAARKAVIEALRHFEGERYVLLSWVIMPNHLHLCFTPAAEWSLERILFTWKRRTTATLNPLQGHTGAIWQRDYFDRLIRDRAHFGRVVRYIRQNPTKAHLPPTDFTLWESPEAREIE